MLTLSCHCGAIHIEITQRPDYVNACNCTLCRKSGAMWGYFDPSQVSVSGTASGYCRRDRDDPSAEIRFCPTCGATTHFVLTASAAARFGNTMMGVNMALADEAELAGLELRYPDGRAWSGEGEFTHVREARIIGAPDTAA